MSQPIQGKIMNYRIGIRTQRSNECLVQFTGVISAAQAGQFFGKKVLWKGKNKEFAGKVMGSHGRNGAVRVKFKKGVPGQAIGTNVELVS